ncbi:MAG: hypothetical protein IKW53_06550 [Clostridia bacterium]|nr:hypothetical protein [Clostridia bacterium]
MCEICRQFKCPSACPNAPAPPVFSKCDGCGADILDGDEYYDIDGECYCENCIYECRKTAEVDHV